MVAAISRNELIRSLEHLDTQALFPVENTNSWSRVSKKFEYQIHIWMISV